MPRTDAQGRGDGAGFEEIDSHSSSVLTIGRGRACPFGTRETKSLHFFGEAPERRPWAIKRDDRPAVFAGRSEWVPGFRRRDTGGAYTNEYPIPPLHTIRRKGGENPRNQPANSVRTSRGKNVTRYTGSQDGNSS